MRVVTFQSNVVLDIILHQGICKNFIPAHKIASRRLSRDNSDIEWFNTSKGFVKHVISEPLPVSSVWNESGLERVYPFYGYSQFYLNSRLHDMSIKTLYYSISSLGVYEMRSIIELEVPDEDVLDVRRSDSQVEVVLPFIKKEWLVSAMTFKDYITDCAHGENAWLYINHVYRDDTYRMCYGKDVVFTGHSYGDNVEGCMSPELLMDVSKFAIQEDYVQRDVINMYILYCYAIRHGMKLIDLKGVSLRVARAEMPEFCDKRLMESFNNCVMELRALFGKDAIPVNQRYYERMPAYAKRKKSNVESNEKSVQENTGVKCTTDNIRSEMESYAESMEISYESLCNLIYNSMPTLLRKEDKLESVESYWHKWKEIQKMLG